ncbi:hypothetical protein [Novosphingobium clariflavum]|uniref:Uncharacterized protein n=1 Tax=Novosphingobium clariflavum TaxID=2029884 RepID=A0ABV6SD55_9SPHN|nr:hypothetical protein [Novosphingobium clariflavum]
MKPFALNETHTSVSESAFLAITILSEIAKWDDRRVSYSGLWEALHGEPPKQGNYWMKVLSPKLSDLSQWCLEHNLPLIGALIVRKGDRLQNEASVKNLYDFAQSAGVKTGRDPVAFVNQHAAMAQMLDISFVAEIDQA